jgi:hypothetical protein
VNPGVAEAAGITYTVEPFDFDGIGGMSKSVTQKQLGPLNNSRRSSGASAEADQLDAQQRPLIDSAYDRPGPTPEQLAASTGEQVRNR